MGTVPFVRWGPFGVAMARRGVEPPCAVAGLGDAVLL